MPSETNDHDAEHRDLAIESLELQIEKLQISLDTKRALRDIGIVTLDESHEALELVKEIQKETERRLEDLQVKVDTHNAKVLEHITGGFQPVDSDIPPGVQGFLDAMFPGAIVIRVGGGSVMFGDFDAPEEKEPFFDPTDAVDAPG